MIRFSSCCGALGVSAAVAALSGCGGSQPMLAEPASVSADFNRAQVVAPNSKSTDLLYASQSRKVFVSTYPQSKYVGTLHVSGGKIAGLCSDKSGNVWVPVRNTSGSAAIYEFSHDGHKIGGLNDPGPAMGCSVDPSTGNLAVADAKSGIALYANAQGQATMLTSSPAYSCTYDDKGNLFVGQSFNIVGLGEYTKSGQFQSVSLKQEIGDAKDRGTNVQWDGKYVAVTELPSKGATKVYRVKVSGSSGTIASTVTLDSKTNADDGYSPYSWIQGTRIVLPISPSRMHLGMWAYPKGGKIEEDISGKGFSFVGATVSVATK